MFNAGIIVTFKLTDAGWVEESRLQPPGLGEADVFSQAMDFKETTIVTSAPGADDAGEKAESFICSSDLFTTVGLGEPTTGQMIFSPETALPHPCL